MYSRVSDFSKLAAGAKDGIPEEEGQLNGRDLNFSAFDEDTIKIPSPALGENLRTLRFQDAPRSYTPSAFDDDAASTTSSSTLLPEAPDGGYGWVIVVASFLIHFICDGISFSFGIMFPQIQEYFKATKTRSGIVASIFLSIPLLSGPLAGVLTDIYDCRKMTMIGGIIAAAGAFVSFFAFDIWQFMFTFAIVTGVGLSFCYNTAIVAVTYYFQEKRALATGIAVCGSGAGTAVVAPLIELLFARFEWRVTLVLLGFLLSLLVGCGLLIKDLEWPQDTIEYKRRKFIEKSEREKLNGLIEAENETVAATAEVVYGDVALRHAISLPLIPTYTQWCLKKTDTSVSKHSVVPKDEAVARCQSDGAFLRFPAEKPKELKPAAAATISPRFGLQNEGPDAPETITGMIRSATELGNQPLEESGERPKETDRLLSENAENGISPNGEQLLRVKLGDGAVPQGAPKKKENETAVEASTGDEKKSNIQKRQNSSAAQKADKVSRMIFSNWPEANTFSPTPLVTNRSTVLPTSFGTTQGRVPASNVISFGWRYDGFNNLSHRAPSAPAIFIRRKRKSKAIKIAKMLESCTEWFAVIKSLLCVPSFSVFLCSTFILYVFFDIPYVNFPEYAVNHLNVTETEASYLVTGIGIFNMLSMLLCGLLADWSVMKKHIMQLYGTFILLAGVCVVVVPYVQSYYVLMIFCTGYGFFISANYVLASVLTVHLLCLYDFQTGYGLLCLVEGLGNLIGPTLVGFVHDSQSTYHNIFIVGGLGTALSGFMVIALEVVLRFTRPSNERAHINNHSSNDADRKTVDTELTQLPNGSYKENGH